VGEQGEPNAYLVEVKWTENYPEDLPEISMDSFFNSHMSPSSKSAIIGSIKNELQDLIGNPMTYTIFEYIRDNRDELSSHISAAPDDVVKTEEVEKMEEESEIKTAKLKPTQLSKAAKRRQADRLNAQGELPRGWNWIDIIKHLSQTGSSKRDTTTTTTTST
jgi:predicted RND superfamily exporter protein